MGGLFHSERHYSHCERPQLHVSMPLEKAERSISNAIRPAVTVGMRFDTRGTGARAKERVSYLRAIHSWNSHTVRFWNGKAWDFHITDLSNIQEAFLECRKAFSVFM